VTKYYFHLYDPETFLDEAGQELADDAAATREAVAGARELACEEVMRGQLDLNHRIEVVDEKGALVKSITFGDAAGIDKSGRKNPDAR
jgi:hypothetical protein